MQSRDVVRGERWRRGRFSAHDRQEVPRCAFGGLSAMERMKNNYGILNSDIRKISKIIPHLFFSLSLSLSLSSVRCAVVCRRLVHSRWDRVWCFRSMGMDAHACGAGKS